MTCCYEKMALFWKPVSKALCQLANSKQNPFKKAFFFDIEYGCRITPISSEKFTANIENPTQGKKISTSNFHHVVKTIP